MTNVNLKYKNMKQKRRSSCMATFNFFYKTITREIRER